MIKTLVALIGALLIQKADLEYTVVGTEEISGSEGYFDYSYIITSERQGTFVQVGSEGARNVPIVTLENSTVCRSITPNIILNTHESGAIYCQTNSYGLTGAFCYFDLTSQSVE